MHVKRSSPSAYKRPCTSRVGVLLFPLLGGCFSNYHTAIAVARLRFASLDVRKTSFRRFELACSV